MGSEAPPAAGAQTALVTGASLLAVSFADPNRISATFKPGEIWSTAKDGATGLDAKMKKKLWNRLKKEVIYRDSPEELERKEREQEQRGVDEYRQTEEYRERVSVDLAAARLKLVDRAKELGATPGKPYVPQAQPTEEEDEEEDDDVPSRQDLFLAKVQTAQRVMAQLRPGMAVALTKEPPGLKADIKALAFQAARTKAAELKEKRKKDDDDNEGKPAAESSKDAVSSSKEKKRDHHHKRSKKSRHRHHDDDDDDDRRRDRHRRRRRDDSV